MAPSAKPIRKFIMTFSPQLLAAQSIIQALDDPAAAYAVLLSALCALQHDFGVIRLNKAQLALDLEMPETRVQDAMDALLRVGIFFIGDIGWRDFDKLCLNPHIAWKGSQIQGDRMCKLVPRLPVR